MFNWRMLDIVFSKRSLSKSTVMAVAFFFCSLNAYADPTPEKAMVFFWAKDSEKSGLNDRRPLGSGFLVNNDGNILTAKHVISSTVVGEQVIASISGKSMFPVPIDETDIQCAANRDICIVRVPPDAIPPTVTSFFQPECGRLEIGTKLYAMGFIGGGDRFGGVIRPDGKVTGRPIRGGLIPTDIDLVPTMSGGPVLNSRNNVVALVKGADNTSHNLTFVSPINSVKSILENLNVRCITINKKSGGHKGLAIVHKISKEVDLLISHHNLRIIPALRHSINDPKHINTRWEAVKNTVPPAIDRLNRIHLLEFELFDLASEGKFGNILKTQNPPPTSLADLDPKLIEKLKQFKLGLTDEATVFHSTTRAPIYMLLHNTYRTLTQLGRPVSHIPVSIKVISSLQRAEDDLKARLEDLITHYEAKTSD